MLPYVVICNNCLVLKSKIVADIVNEVVTKQETEFKKSDGTKKSKYDTFSMSGTENFLFLFL